MCRSFLCISQDPVIGNGQRSGTFWERVAEHYNQNRPTTGGERPARSLETKWGSMKHDVVKFVRVYKQVNLCCKSGSSFDNILENALELYKVKHPKQQSFIFFHCWLLVGDVPRWMESVPDTRQRLAARVSPLPSSKHKTAFTDRDEDEDCGGLPPSSMFEDPRAQSPGSCTTSAPPCRFKLPVGQKIAKLDLCAVQAKECAMRAHAKATTDVAAANMARAQVLRDQAALAFSQSLTRSAFHSKHAVSWSSGDRRRFCG